MPLTHEQLATLLGVGRSYTSRVIQTFKAEGVLETRRGSILVATTTPCRRACLCNEVVKNHFEEVLRGVYPNRGGPEQLKPDRVWRENRLTNPPNKPLFFGYF